MANKKIIIARTGIDHYAKGKAKVCNGSALMHLFLFHILGRRVANAVLTNGK